MSRQRDLLHVIAVAVSNSFGVDVSQLRGSDRTHRIAHARWACWVIARAHTRISYPEIGRWFGNRDHTTVMHGVKNWPLKADAEMTDRFQAANRVAREEIAKYRADLRPVRAEVFISRRASQEWKRRLEHARRARVDRMWQDLVDTATLDEIEHLLEQAKKGQAA